MILDHHPRQKDYWNKLVQVVTPSGKIFAQPTYLLRLYPETFYSYDAYMDIPRIEVVPSFNRVIFPEINMTWTVIYGPKESIISGYFRGENTPNNPPAWMFGLRLTTN